jgi:hypothetical protein
MTIPVSYNMEYLYAAPEGEPNQPSSKTDAVYNNVDMASPYYIIESSAHNINGYGGLRASVATGINEAIASIHAALTSGTGGFVPSTDDRGSFVGELRFYIKNGVQLTDGALAEFAFYNGLLGQMEILDATAAHGNLNSLVEFVVCPAFPIRGITILNPTDYQTVNRYPAAPYESMGNNSTNYGYPIYFERSGLLAPSKTLGVYGTPRYAYQISYSLDNGVSFTESGRVAENRTSNSQMSNPTTAAANYEGQVDYFSEALPYYMTTGSGKIFPADVAYSSQLTDQPDGPGLDSMGYGGVIRVIWKADANFPYRSENAKLKITELEDANANSETALVDRPPYKDSTRHGISENSFVIGRIFFAQLNGECQYFRTEENFSAPSYFTAGIWINLNNDNGAGSNPGVIASSSGSEAPAGSIGGSWLLYLKDGIYPAFRVRAEEGGWLCDIVSSNPIGVYSNVDANGDIVVNSLHSANWTHLAVVVASNAITLYVDGEQVAQYTDPNGATARPYHSRMPIWVGVNPDANFETNVDFLYAGVKELEVWNAALTQTQLRQYVSGVPSPTLASNLGPLTSIPNDPKATLEIYANLQGVNSDLASDRKYQWDKNNLNYFVYCETSKGATSNNDAIKYRPDGSHIKLTSPKCGEGVSNLKGHTYEIRWVSYGIGSSLPAENGEGDIMIQLTRDNGKNWFDAIGTQVDDEPTNGHFALSLDNEEVEAGSAIWEPYNNVTLTSIANDIQGVFDIPNNYVKTVKLRISGTEVRDQSDIYAESDYFIVAPHFAFVNKPSSKLTIDGSQTLNVTTQNAFMEAWIKPYTFPTDGDGKGYYPIITKMNPDATSEEDGLHYALRLLPTGQLQFAIANYDATNGTRDIRTANSDSYFKNVLSEPNEKYYDSLWYHVGVYLNIPTNGTQSYITFFIDGTAQTADSIRIQLGDNLKLETKNTYPTYLGYEPDVNGGESYFDGEIKEVRFWRNNPAGMSDKEFDANYSVRKLYEFIQGAATVRANELTQVGTTNYAQGLIAAYSMDGGSWVNDGADGTIKAYPANTALNLHTFSACGDRLYAASYPFIKLVEPIADQKVGNTDTIRVRWIGFDYNRNDMISFTSGTTAKRSDLGISEGAGGGQTNDFYPAVASMFENSAFANSLSLPTQINPFEFQGTTSKSQYAGLLNMSLANSDVKRDRSYDEQGTVPSTQTNGRLQLFARANINSPDPLEYSNDDGKINTLMSEGPVFSITPASNFTVRLLLEGYHIGGVIGKTAQTGILGTEYESNGLNIRFYQNEAGTPGDFVANSTTLNKASYSKTAMNPANRNKGDFSYANIPFTLTEAVDGQYFVVIDNINYLPIMSAFAATFKYVGDDETTWGVESGWDFTGWNGAEGNVMTSTDDPLTPGNVFTAYMMEVPTADRNSLTGTFTLTPLNFNAGSGSKNIADATAIAAMVAGDVVKDGYINTNDYESIRDSAAMSTLAKYSLRGTGVPANAIDRTMVDNNYGKVSSLRELADITSVLYPTVDEEQSTALTEYLNGRTALEVNAEVERINAEVAAMHKAKIAETLQGGIDYIVTATPYVNGNYVDVPVYIQNIGDIWSMANASFPIEFDPTVVSFAGLVETTPVMFSNNSAAGYLKAFYAPSDVANDPIANTYSIEINFDARSSSNKPGLTVPSTKTYLGTLRFNLLRNDESIFFNWSQWAAVLSVDGRELTPDGTFEDIKPIIVEKAVILVAPNGGEVFTAGTGTNIVWKSPIVSRNVNLEYSIDNGSNWTVITTTGPIQVTLCDYIWSTPYVSTNQALVRIVDATSREVLARSAKVFSITMAPTEIVRPAAVDPTYIAGTKDVIKWHCSQDITVYFEYSENGINGWTKITDIVNAQLGETPWTVKASNTCGAVIRMVNSKTGEVLATSEPFRVASGSVTLTSPKKGDQLNKNTKIAIKWTSSVVTKFNLEYSTDAGAHWTTIAENVTASAKQTTWTTPDVVTTNAIIRAVNGSNSCIEYFRTGLFAIGKTDIEEPIAETSSAIANINPNPASDVATLTYNVTDNTNVSISIYDVRGNKVLDIVAGEYTTAGIHSLNFNVTNLSSGVYVIRMQAGASFAVKEFVVVK